MSDMTLPDRLRDLAETLVGDEWEHPIDAVETCSAAADELELLTRERDDARGIIAEKLHLRRCRECVLEFYAADSVAPYCRCGSWNTERINTGKDLRMKIIGVQSRTTYLVELRVDELQSLRNENDCAYQTDVACIGREYAIDSAWENIQALDDHRKELPRIANKLRALADLLEPIQCEIPTGDGKDAT